MKRFFLIVLLTLAGCSIYGDYTFDQTEYFQYSRLASTAKLSVEHCANPALMETKVLPQLEDQANTLVSYTKYRGNIESQKVAAILNNFVVEMRAAYMRTPPPSKTYCEFKLDNISKGADRMLNSLSNL